MSLNRYIGVVRDDPRADWQPNDFATKRDFQDKNPPKSDADFYRTYGM